MPVGSPLRHPLSPLFIPSESLVPPPLSLSLSLSLSAGCDRAIPHVIPRLPRPVAEITLIIPVSAAKLPSRQRTSEGLSGAQAITLFCPSFQSSPPGAEGLFMSGWEEI